MGDMSDVLENVSTDTAIGYGAGVMVNVLFGVSTGAFVAGTSVMTAISGPLVLILTAIGFGVGFARGWKKYKTA